MRGVKQGKCLAPGASAEVSHGPPVRWQSARQCSVALSQAPLLRTVKTCHASSTILGVKLALAWATCPLAGGAPQRKLGRSSPVWRRLLALRTSCSVGFAQEAKLQCAGRWGRPGLAPSAT